MNVAIAWLAWMLKPYPKYYSERPDVDGNRVAIDMAALKATRGKIGFAGARPIRHICTICQKPFWTERKQEATCKKWECYKKFHCRKGAR